MDTLTVQVMVAIMMVINNFAIETGINLIIVMFRIVVVYISDYRLVHKNRLVHISMEHDSCKFEVTHTKLQTD